MRAVVTVVGKDKTGIIARVSGLFYEKNINILDISQKLMQNLFTMISLVDLSNSSVDFDGLKAELKKVGEELNVSITILPEDMFKSVNGERNE
ncbi:MAG: ACT domain-containing protein [Clostridia bacterium]|nr:ACT domain-containing protein [Clostridia bacterium]